MSNIINLQNPVPILHQPKSSIITNTLIPKNDTYEVSVSKKEFKIKNKISEMNSNISNSILGVLLDFFDKKEDMTWIQHFKYIFLKEQRYKYIGLFLIIISLILYLINYIYNKYYLQVFFTNKTKK